jgi:hypothetical protein
MVVELFVVNRKRNKPQHGFGKSGGVNTIFLNNNISIT